MKITIVGAGNAGCAYAFKLSQKGLNVTLLKTTFSINDENFETIRNNKGIWGIDNTSDRKKKFVSLDLATRNIEEALIDSEIVIVMVQSLYHKNIADMIVPHLSSKIKLLLIIPGNLGSLYFREKIKSYNYLNVMPIIAEGESTAIDARIIEPGLVQILFKNVRNALGFIPSSKSRDGLIIAKQLFSTYCSTRSNIVESALHNPNLIVHTIGTILSASRIEIAKGEFWMYKEAFSPSIWNVINALDYEKNEIIKAYNGNSMSYLDAAHWRNYEDLSVNSKESFDNYAKKGGPKGPNSINTRYLNEDVPNGLVLLEKLGNLVGIETPTASSLITIASVLLDKNFRNLGRNFKELGFSTSEQLKAIL